MTNSTLYVRSLGRTSYEEADSLQRALHKSEDDYLLFLEHNPVYTLGSSTKQEHLTALDQNDLVVEADRGGSVTFHGPGQLVCYPVVSVGQTRGDLRSSLTFIKSLQETLIEALRLVGIETLSFKDYTGVWFDRGPKHEDADRYVKIAAIGVKVAQGRTRHGFALNINTNMDAFRKIVPCGIEEYQPASLHELGFDHISEQEIIEAFIKCFVEYREYESVKIASVVEPVKQSTQKKAPLPRDLSHLMASNQNEAVSAVQPQIRLLGRLSQAGVAVDLDKDRRARPEWMKNTFNNSDGYKELKDLSRDLSLHTVCEEAGCPNIYECWEQKTATFMILGERCTRACGFCLVDTRKPIEPDETEPANVGLAVSKLGLEFAVITCVARDDLEDDGSTQFANTVKEIRKQSPNTKVELLISDCRGKSDSLNIIFDEKPDVLNHNIETVARLQRAVRPSAGYARSLSVLARAKDAGLITKSGIIVGMGETEVEVLETMRDLKNVGIDIVTIGQYLQPTPAHLPVHRFVEPAEFERYKAYGEAIGINHVESGPLVRSSYHAKSAAQSSI